MNNTSGNITERTMISLPLVLSIISVLITLSVAMLSYAKYNNNQNKELETKLKIMIEQKVDSALFAAELKHFRETINLVNNQNENRFTYINNSLRMINVKLDEYGKELKNVK